MAKNGYNIKECIYEADVFAGIPIIGNGVGMKYFIGDTYQVLSR